jgi:hypothetical protein
VAAAVSATAASTCRSAVCSTEKQLLGIPDAANAAAAPEHSRLNPIVANCRILFQLLHQPVARLFISRWLPSVKHTQDAILLHNRHQPFIAHSHPKMLVVHFQRLHTLPNSSFSRLKTFCAQIACPSPTQ